MSGKHHTDLMISLLLPWLSNPIPTTLSKPPRSAIRQVQLAKVARVSERFRDLVIPLLYGNIVTDNLPRLLEQKNIVARTQLFLHTRSLRIEYSDKQKLDPTYAELCDRRIKGAWTMCGLSEPERVVEKQRECRAELQEFLRMFDTLSETVILPKLRTIAVGSMYGHEPDTWDQLDETPLLINRDDEQYSPLEHCAAHFANFINRSPVHHLCVRDLFGPLSTPQCAQALANTPSITAHFEQSDTPRLPFFLNTSVPVRWIFDGDSTYNWEEILLYMGQRIEKLAVRRAMLFQKPSLALDIFCSTSLTSQQHYIPTHSLFQPSTPHAHSVIYHTSSVVYTLSLDVQTQRCAHLEVEARRSLERGFVRTFGLTGADIYPNDSLRWHPSASAPTCEACGTSAPA